VLGSVVLDAAIGMVFIYLLLSLIASTLQEMLVAFLQARSANLHRGMLSLFSEESIEEGTTLVDSIYNHGLVRGLYQDHGFNPDDPTSPTMVPSKWNRMRAWLQKKIGIAPQSDVQFVTDPLMLPSYIPSRTFALAMIDILNRDKFNGNPVQNITDFLSQHHWQFRNNKAVQAMLSLSITAGSDVDKFRGNLENWYNDSMDRASGWYKKNTQATLLILGILLAVVFNVDSIHIGRTLWLDRDARSGMVAAAEQYVKNPPADQPKALSDRLKKTAADFESVSGDLLPVGWKSGDFPSPAWRTWPWKWTWAWSLTWAEFLIYFERVSGWLITAVAISLGAPFWFDTLNKFMVVRSTIKPQEKSQTEASKD
jgi:hypothetical protein